MDAEDIVIVHKSEEPEEGEETATDTVNYTTELFKAMLEGDTARQKELKEMLVRIGYSTDTINNSVNTHIKNRYKMGELTEGETRRLLGVTDDNDWYWVKDQMDHEIAHAADSAYKYTKFGDFFEAVESNNAAGVKAEVTRLTSNGTKAGTVKGQVTSRYKTDYIAARKAGDKQTAAEIKNKALTAYQALGYNWNTENATIEREWK